MTPEMRLYYEIQGFSKTYPVADSVLAFQPYRCP